MDGMAYVIATVWLVSRTVPAHRSALQVPHRCQRGVRDQSGWCKGLKWAGRPHLREANAHLPIEQRGIHQRPDHKLHSN